MDLRPALIPLHGLVWRLALFGAPRREVCGMQVVCIASSETIDDEMKRLRAAFELVAVHDVRRWGRILRDVRQIVLADAGGPEYIGTIGACLLSVGFVDRVSVIDLALTLVHEASHARLWHARIGRAEEQRDRLERACIRSEKRFAETLHGRDREMALKTVEGELSGPAWWTREAITKRRDKELTAMGIPQWLIRLYRNLRR